MNSIALATRGIICQGQGGGATIVTSVSPQMRQEDFEPEINAKSVSAPRIIKETVVDLKPHIKKPRNK